MRECTGGGAFAESIIGTLFGYAARAGSKIALMDAGVRRGFRGELLYVRYGSEMLRIRSGVRELISAKNLNEIHSNIALYLA